MPGVRITRKEIKRDELATTIGGLRSVVEEHARSVVIAVGALIVLSAAVTAGIWYSRGREASAQASLAAVYRAANAPVVEDGGLTAAASTSYATRRQKYEEVVRLAGAVIADHPGSKAASWAAYYKGLGLKELGSHAEALEALAPLAAGTEDDFLAACAKFMQGQVHETQGDAAGALEIYASLAAAAPARFPADMVLMTQARLLERQGRGEEAREVYRRIMQEFPDSPYAQQASQRSAPAGG